MIQFKRFAAGDYKDKDVADFFNTHLVDHHKVTEQGDVIVFYRELHEIGLDPMDKLERLNNTIKEAERDILDAELGVAECEGNRADLDELISGTSPNEKQKWDVLQSEREDNERQLTMHKKTIEGRSRQVFDLRTAAAALIQELS